MNQLIGKGFFIWKIPMCENGDPSKIASTAKRAGLSHVLIKIANGIYDYNYDSVSKKDLVKPVAIALKDEGIQVWGWHYVYGDLPEQEVQTAIRQIMKVPLDGYVIDAESEYLDKHIPCRTFIDRLRSTLPDLPIALNSFRFPRYHPQLPWKDFLSGVNINMPQVYWEQAHNPGEQLRKCLSEFQNITPFRPIVPTGSAYGANNWKPTTQDIVELFNTAIQLNLPAINFYSWDYCRSKLPDIWDTISGINWPNSTNPIKDIADSFIDALNKFNLDDLITLYHANAVHITAQSTIQGIVSIRSWYEQYIHQSATSLHFDAIAIESFKNSRHIHWKSTSKDGIIKSGIDTIGILDGKIVYHYSSMT